MIDFISLNTKADIQCIIMRNSMRGSRSYIDRLHGELQPGPTG